MNLSLLSESFPSKSLDVWYQKSKRNLPWRENPLPYNVWISEIMLQQTQVQNVLPYYERFLKIFPKIKSLASARESDVLNLWTGLGYYSRARNIYKSAKIIMENWKGKFPASEEALLELPGIGRYTAGAILSIAFNQPRPILDGNVKRVFSRFFLIDSEKDMWTLAEHIVLSAKKSGILPSNFNQALMELGALVCLPQNPDCLKCPIQKGCRAKSKNLQTSYPKPKKKEKTKDLKFAILAIKKKKRGLEEKDRFLVRRRPEKEKWLKKLWEFPMLEIPLGLNQSNTSELESKFSGGFGGGVAIHSFLGEIRHAITRHRLKIWVFDASIKKNSNSFLWLTKEECAQISSSSILRKTLALIK